MRKNCDGEKTTHLAILTNYTFLKNPPLSKHEEVILECRISTFMGARLAGAFRVGQILLIFGIRPDEYEHSASNNTGLSNEHHGTTAIFSKTAYASLIKFRQIVQTVSLKKVYRRYLQENSGTRTTRSFDFVEPYFNNWIDFIVVRYSATTVTTVAYVKVCSLYLDRFLA
jgi:hypothetical protein